MPRQRRQLALLHWHHHCVPDSRLTKGAPSDLRVDPRWQPHNEPLGSTIPTAAGHGQPQAPMARQRGCPFLVLGGGSYESAHLASCSLDVRVGPLRRRRRTTFLDRLTRGRRVLGLSPPGSIARNAGGQQARVRELSGVGPRATADRVTSRSPATAALAVDRNQSRREIFHHTGKIPQGECSRRQNSGLI